MLTQEQIEEIRMHLNKAQNPLFFFDNDADGLCSFLLLARMIGRGKGIAIKSFPDLNESYARKIYELNPDYIFVLDKPIISEGFIDEVRKNNLPFIWIDHHDVKAIDMDGITYYNPMQNKEKSNEPVTYLSYKIAEKKEDLWIAMIGCTSDNYFPEFAEEFENQFPDLWKSGIKTAFQALYKTELGKITRILNFALKDRTSNVVRMLKTLQKLKDPREILEDTSKNQLLYRFNQVNKKYKKLLEKAESLAGMRRLLYFQYGGDLSLSADIANELSYNYPDKIIVVAYLKGTKANMSLRGKGIREITLKAIEGLEDATGGGHEGATGAKINLEDLPKFKEKIEKLVNFL